MFFLSPGSGTFVDDAIHEIAPEWLTTQYARSQVISGNWVYVATPTVVNSLRIGVLPLPPDFRYARCRRESRQLQLSMAAPTTSTPAKRIPLSVAFRDSQINGYPSFQLGGPASWPKSVGPDSVYQFNDSVSWQKGNHAIKFGGEILLNRSDDNVTSNNKGPRGIQGSR